MTKALLWILSTTLLSIAAVAQAVTDAPVNWTTYNIKAHKLSIQFPKLPIHYFQADLCNEKRIDYFIAYAEETVYTLAIIKKEQPAFALSLCKTSSKFGRETLDSRRADLEKLGVKQAVSDGKELWQISRGARLERIWIFDDLKKNRWVELSVTGRDSLPRENEYVGSLALLLSKDGIEAGDGSPQTLGDRGVDTTYFAPMPDPRSNESDETPKTNDSEKADLLTIVSKVKARYTDAARSNREMGTVTLRVTFLANGGIGDIQVVKALKYGLTEQAIAAAKKIVFLPQRIGGKVASTSRPVTYSFNIY